MRYFDNHADTLTELPEGGSLYENENDVDLKRVDAFADTYTQVFALWRDMAQVDNKRVDEEFERVYDRARGLIAAQSGRVELVTDAKSMHAAHAAGHAAAFLSLEDASFAGSHISEAYDRGIRFCMLAWNYENSYACGAACDQRRGLTQRGRKLVCQLVGQGMVMDASHLSDAGVDDLLSLVEGPVIASHSNARAVCNVPRNLPDRYIEEIARRGGIIGLNLFAPFVADDPSVDDVLRHADHIMEIGGEDVLAMGADFDGCDGLFPKGIAGVQSIPSLRAAFATSFGEELAEKVFFTNSEAFIERNF
ncbi:MAG: dipeptidase [Tractidigestivibacter sp.]|uniref:dipeptidase n=1 Tax=Tractidigestivibacter sp. TaxID=2847320 RepID=UPI003D904D58